MRIKWNESFPFRLAVRTGIFLAIVLFLMTASSYISVAWLLNKSVDSTLLINAQSMISLWKRQGSIERFYWHDGSYRVGKPDGQIVAEQIHGDGDGHSKHGDAHPPDGEDREVPINFPDMNFPGGDVPVFVTWLEKEHGQVTGPASLLYGLLPIEKSYRTVYVPFLLGQEKYILEFATESENTYKLLRKILVVLTSIAGGGLVFIVSVVAFFSREGFRPVRQITGTIKTIREKTLSTRLKVPTRDRTLDDLVRVLNGMLDRLDRAFQSQSRFVQDASHELKTPLAVLRSDIEITLRRNRTEDEYRACLQRCLDEVEHMSHLTRQLLTLARYDQAAKLELKPVSLNEAIERSLSHLRTALESKKIRLIRQPETNVQAAGEPVALEMVFSNLLQNAIRAVGEGGEIRIGIREDGPWAVAEIADNGTGIPQEAIPYLFDRFYRVDEARNRQSGGTGLGLAICKSIVGAHGGKIEVKSEPGKGSVFSVYLPRIANGTASSRAGQPEP